MACETKTPTNPTHDIQGMTDAGPQLQKQNRSQNSIQDVSAAAVYAVEWLTKNESALATDGLYRTVVKNSMRWNVHSATTYDDHCQSAIVAGDATRSFQTKMKYVKPNEGSR
jgi:hypothetical protein